MSHFVVLTLVRPEDAETPDTLGNKVAELLAPYDENMEVEHYRREEDDSDYTTAKSVEKMVEFYNSCEEREKMYPTTYEALKEKEGQGLFPGGDYLQSRLKANIEKMDEMDRLLEKYGPPKADDREGLRRWYAGDWSGEDLYFDLEDGTPFIMTTYNSKSKWDYYLIGGSWTGMLTGYDPAEDPENWETCRVCEGTGRRDDELGRRHRERNPEYACNGCDGKGWHVKCISQFRDYEGDVQPVANLLKQIEESAPGELPEEQEEEQEEREAASVPADGLPDRLARDPLRRSHPRRGVASARQHGPVQHVPRRAGAGRLGEDRDGDPYRARRLLRGRR